MEFALSTHWNASRHARGEDLIEEILGLGFTRVELGYDLRLELVEGVKAMVARQAGAGGQPAQHLPGPAGRVPWPPRNLHLGSTDARERAQAVSYTAKTLRFAAELGARVVVTHAGNVDMTRFSGDLFDLALSGQTYTRASKN
jgi:sugar phosphate isomerase/epimerase